MPTPHGELSVSWTRGESFILRLTAPHGMTARIELPALDGSSEIRVAGRHVMAHRQGQWWIVEEEVSGTVEIEER